MKLFMSGTRLIGVGLVDHIFASGQIIMKERWSEYLSDSTPEGLLSPEWNAWRFKDPANNYKEMAETSGFQALCSKVCEIILGLKGAFLVKDDRVLKGPLGRSLRSFARTAHSAHSLRSAPLRYARFARSLRSRARSLTLLTPSWDS